MFVSTFFSFIFSDTNWQVVVYRKVIRKRQEKDMVVHIKLIRKRQFIIRRNLKYGHDKDVTK